VMRLQMLQWEFWIQFFENLLPSSSLFFLLDFFTQTQVVTQPSIPGGRGISCPAQTGLALAGIQ
jgi:hypothetical protein